MNKIKNIKSVADLNEKHEVLNIDFIEKDITSDIVVVYYKKKIDVTKLEDEYLILLYVDPEKKDRLLPALKKINEYIIEEKKIDKKNIHNIKTENKNLIKEIKENWIEKRKELNLIDEEEEVIKQISKLFSESADLNASDIHIEIRKNITYIRLRINGDLEYYDRYSQDLGKKVVSAMYNALAESISSTQLDDKKPQDGLIDKEFSNKRYRLRLATLPADNDGLDVILRMLDIPDENTSYIDLDTLGYRKTEIEKTELARREPNGLILLAGVTGSGKSTTLSNLIKKTIIENEGKIKVITIEDPPEYYIRGATQVAVKRDKDGDAKKAFLANIRATMRSDPDVIMIGEIRDQQTAEMAVTAAQTGHLVFSTIHASSALASLNRLENMGITRETLSSPNFIAALVYQTLVKKNCPHCSIPLSENISDLPKKYTIEKILKEDFDVTWKDIKEVKNYIADKNHLNILTGLLDLEKKKISEIEEIKKVYIEKNSKIDYSGLIKRISKVIDIDNSNIRFKNELGCEHCNFTGIKGRTTIAEVVKPDSYMLDLIYNNRDREVESYWKKNLRGSDVVEIGLEKLKEGILDPWEYESKLNLIGLK